jgi:hypothetical protein
LGDKKIINGQHGIYRENREVQAVDRKKYVHEFILELAV